MAYMAYIEDCLREWGSTFRNFSEENGVFIDWELGLPHDSFTITLSSIEDMKRLIAMLEFCTEYEKESFELFYKWFKQNKGKED